MPTRKHTVLLAVIGFGCTSFLQVARRGSSVAPLLPIMAAVFIAFLVIGAALPVLPLHVHETLGLGTFLVGLVAGSQFAAANRLARVGRPTCGSERRESGGRDGAADRGRRRAPVFPVAELHHHPGDV